MLTFSGIKENLYYLRDLLGAPTILLAALLISFQMGWVPGTAVGNHMQESRDLLIVHNSVDTKEHNEIIIQHTEQITRLVNGLKAICFNTAKTDNQVRECGKL